MSGWGLLGAAMAGIGEGADKAIVNQHKIDEANALKEQRIQEIREQGNINNQQINLQANLNDRNAARDDARGLIAKAEDNSAALDLYQGKKDIDLKTETDPANVDAAATAEVRAAKIKDAYSDSRIDPVKTQLDHDKIRAQIKRDLADAKSTGDKALAEQNKTKFEVFSKQREQIQTALDELSVNSDPKDPTRIELKAKLEAIDQQIQGIYGETTPTIVLPDDVAGLNPKSDKTSSENNPVSKPKPQEKPAHIWTKEEVDALPQGSQEWQNAVTEWSNQANQKIGERQRADLKNQTNQLVDKGKGLLSQAVSAMKPADSQPILPDKELQRLFSQLPPNEQARIMGIRDKNEQQRELLKAIQRFKAV
jgi:hypothetical protein